MRKLSFRPIAFTTALTLLLSACDDAMAPAPHAPPAASRAISDAAHGDIEDQNPGFWWLPPMVDQTTLSGSFQSAFSPTVKVILCRKSLDETVTCEPGKTAVESPQTSGLFAEFGVGTGLMVEADHFKVEFDTEAFGLEPTVSGDTTVYRIFAFTDSLPDFGGPFVLGYADFQLAETGKEVKKLSGEDTTTIALVDGRTLPIKFFVNEEAYPHELVTNPEATEVAGIGTVCEINCSVTVVSTEDTTEASLVDSAGAELTAILFEPGDVGTTSVLVIDERIEEGEGANCAVGVNLEKKNCFRYEITPSVPFNNPVRMGICPVDVPKGEGVWRILQVDDGVINRPPEVDVSDFLDCATSTAFLHRVLDWLIRPLYAEDFDGTQLQGTSDLFWSLDAEASTASSGGTVEAGSTLPITISLVGTHPEPDVPLEGEPVDFLITAGAGSLAAPTGVTPVSTTLADDGVTIIGMRLLTDVNGEATAEWTVAAGANTLEANTPEAEGGPFVFAADGVAAIFFATFRNDETGSPPGAPEVGTWTLDQTGGAILVQPSHGDLTDRPVTMTRTTTGPLTLFGTVAGTPPSTGVYNVRWSSNVTEPSSGGVAVTFQLGASNNAIVATAAYTSVADVRYNGDATGLAFASETAQAFDLVVDLDQQKTSLLVDGVPVAGAQGQPFLSAAPDLANVGIRNTSTTDLAVAGWDDIQIALAEIQSVQVSPASVSLQVGETATLSATALDATGAIVSGGTTAWSSSDPSVATVDGGGVVTAVAGGTTTIMASVDGVTATAEVFVSGVVSRWTADATTPDAYGDVVGANHGSPIGSAPVVTGGITGSAFSLDGTGGFVFAPGKHIRTAPSLTLSTWVNLDPAGPQDVIQRFITLQGEKAVLRMDGQNTPGQLDFFVTLASTGATAHVRANGLLETGCFHHVAGTFDDATSTMRLYLDGEFIGGATVNGSLVESTDIELGSPTEPLFGLLDDAEVHNRALSAAEVAALHAGGGTGLCSSPPADLIITSQGYSPSDPTSADGVLFDAVVANVGGSTADTGRVEFSVLSALVGGGIARLPHSAIAPGDSLLIRQFRNTFAPGDYTYTVTADIDQVVDESDEGNNSLTTTLTIAVPPLYGVNESDDGLSLIDLATGQATFISRLDADETRFTTPVALTLRPWIRAPDDERLLVWNNSGPDGVLLTVNPCTGQATQVNASASGVGLQALAVTAGDDLYGGDISLYSIDPGTGAPTLIGSLGNNQRVAGMDFWGGTLYGLTFSNDLVTIDLATGAATTIATLNEDIGTPGSIAFDPAGGGVRIIGTGFNGPQGSIIFDIDRDTGAVSNIRALSGGSAPQGLAFAPPCRQ